MHLLIEQHRKAISEVCRRHGIRRLEVFGSAARGDDFDPQHSDVDFLIQLDPHAHIGLSEYFAAKGELERILGREVDLVEASAIRNPYLRADIDRLRELVYAA